MKSNSLGTLAATCLVSAAVATSVAQAASPPAQVIVPGEKIFPESLTSGPDGSLYIGSIGQKAIYRAKPGAATAETFVQPGADGLASIFGVFADGKSNTLWACSATPTFAATPGGPTPPPATLRAYDLKSGAAKGVYPFPAAGSFCNDIAIGPDGSAYATDTNNMEVVRLQKGGKELEVWAGNGAFGPKGGVLDGIAVLGKRLIVNTLGTSKVFSIPIESDGKAGAVTEVKLDNPVVRPDGMRSFGKDSVLIIEGGAGQLSKITLRGDNGKVQPIKNGFDGPVAVTVVGTTGYVLEGQLSSMMRRPPAPGATAPPPPPAKPFHALAVEVGKP